MKYTREQIEHSIKIDDIFSKANAMPISGKGAMLRQLLADNDALREDAARYREIKVGQNFSVVDWSGELLRMHLLDDAIDAARKQSDDLARKENT